MPVISVVQRQTFLFVFCNRNLRNLLLEGNTIETLPLELGKLTNNNYFIYHTCMNRTGKHVNNLLSCPVSYLDSKGINVAVNLKI